MATSASAGVAWRCLIDDRAAEPVEHDDAAPRFAQHVGQMSSDWERAAKAEDVNVFGGAQDFNGAGEVAFTDAVLQALQRHNAFGRETETAPNADYWRRRNGRHAACG